MVDSFELRAEIVRNGYTVRSLSKEMNMSQNTLGRKVNGKVAFTVPEVQKLCILLRIKSDQRKISIFLPDATH